MGGQRGDDLAQEAARLVVGAGVVRREQAGARRLRVVGESDGVVDALAFGVQPNGVGMDITEGNLGGYCASGSFAFGEPQKSSGKPFGTTSRRADDRPQTPERDALRPSAAGVAATRRVLGSTFWDIR